MQSIIKAVAIAGFFGSSAAVSANAQALYAGVRVGAATPVGDFAETSAASGSDAFLQNATAGLGSHLFGGPGYVGNCNVAVTPATPCHGYRAWTPGYTWQEKVEQGVNRFILSGDANYRPFSWNQTRLTVGNDFTDRADVDLRYRGEAPPLNATYRLGFAGEGVAILCVRHRPALEPAVEDGLDALER